MAQLTVSEVEIRYYTTTHGRLYVPCIHVEETASEIVDYINTTPVSDVISFSVLSTTLNADGTGGFISPMNNGDIIELSDTGFFIKRNDSGGTPKFEVYRGTTMITSLQSSDPVFRLHLIITSDEYVVARITSFRMNASFDFLQLATSHSWGELKQQAGLTYSYQVLGIQTAQGNQGLSLLNKPLYDGSSVYDSDPYSRGGSSGGGGGTGDFDNTSDTIGLPSLPSLSGLNTGFFTAFIPSASQMQSVSNYLWNNALTDILDPDTGLGEKVDALKKIVANPYEAIMGCSIIPVTPPTAGSKELKMYGILETGISLPYASTRWVKVDCGTLNIHEFWGSYLDYSPYTKTTSLYLPYIGTVSIDIDLIMAKSLQVVYYVDILSGICVAFILVDGSVKFHYQGQCSTQVPITNADYSSVISAGIGLIGNASQVVGSAVTGGAGGGIGGAVAGAVSGAISQAPAVASNVMSAKPDIRSGGAIGSSAGILSVQRPYLIIERPKQSVPAFQNHFTGYPSNVTAKVGDLTGYTEFESINLDGIALTDAEKSELDSILKGGVYL